MPKKKKKFLKKKKSFRIAIDSGDIKSVQEILSSEPSLLNTRYKNGLTPLMLAIESNTYSRSIVDLFLSSKEIQLSMVDDARKTALVHAVIHNRIDLIKVLVHSGANLNLLDSSGASPLAYAVDFHDEKMTQALLDAKADPNFSAKNKLTPLIISAQDNQLSLVKILISSKAIIDNKCSKYGRTALHWATFNGHIQVMSLLLQSGADSSSFSKHGESILYLFHRHWHTYAQYNKQFNLITELRQLSDSIDSVKSEINALSYVNNRDIQGPETKVEGYSVQYGEQLPRRQAVESAEKSNILSSSDSDSYPSPPFIQQNSARLMQPGEQEGLPLTPEGYQRHDIPLRTIPVNHKSDNKHGEEESDQPGAASLGRTSEKNHWTITGFINSTISSLTTL